MPNRYCLRNKDKFVEVEHTQSGLDRLKAFRAHSPEFKGRHIHEAFQLDTNLILPYVIYLRYTDAQACGCMVDKADLPTLLGIDPYLDKYIERTLKE
jgi:hypothetical protein